MRKRLKLILMFTMFIALFFGFLHLFVPDRTLYIYYTCSGCGHRNRYGGWNAWAFDFKYKHPVSDLPSDEHYANHFNSGWRGKMDILSMALNSVHL